MKVKLIFLIFSSLFYCCCQEKKTKDIFDVHGKEWQIVNFYHVSENIGDDGDFLIKFEKDEMSWIANINAKSRSFIYFNYEIYNNEKINSLILKNCDDGRLNGNYNISVDTIATFPKQNVLRIILDSENIYIEARRLQNTSSRSPLSEE